MLKWTAALAALVLASGAAFLAYEIMQMGKHYAEDWDRADIDLSDEALEALWQDVLRSIEHEDERPA